MSTLNKVIIFGGTGFIGLQLAEQLKQNGFYPIIVGRNKTSNTFKYLRWDAQQLGVWQEELENAVAVINLTGKSVNCIKTPENIDEILKSRVDSTRLIGKALGETKYLPKVWIQMSTAHIYGDSLNRTCTESSSLGYGLAPFVGQQWEKAFTESLPPTMRGVILRTGFVLGKNGGALIELTKIAKWGLGGRVGSGKQGMSWIHMEDLNNFIVTAINQNSYNGVYNLSSPNPVANHSFMKSLRQSVKMPFGLSAPSFITKLGAKLIFKTDPELALYGRYVVSEKLRNSNFNFKYSHLDSALKNLV